MTVDAIRYSMLRTPLRECFALVRDEGPVREFVAVGGVGLRFFRIANDNARLRTL